MSKLKNHHNHSNIVDFLVVELLLRRFLNFIIAIYIRVAVIVARGIIIACFTLRCELNIVVILVDLNILWDFLLSL
jgi:hypothetical protein